MTDYQQGRTDRSLQNLKNRWADNNISPLMFFHDHFAKYTHMTYGEFLQLINYHGTITASLEKAIDDFWEISE